MKPTRRTNFSNFILGMKIYMFRTVPLSIIRSFSLYTQQWYMSCRFADSLRAGSPDIYHCCVYSEKLLMIDSICHTGLLTACEQDQAVSKPVRHILSNIRSFSLYTQQWYMLGDPARKLSANLHDIYHCCGWNIVPSWSCSQAVSKPAWHIPLLCLQWKTSDDGHRNSPKHVEFHSKSKIWEISASSWFYYKKFNTMHGHINVKP